MDGCTYPIPNKFAVAAPPKPCKSTSGAIAVQVPYHDPRGRMVLQWQVLCTQHTCETAVWKYLRNVPRRPLLDDEVALLLSTGYTKNELQAEGLMIVADPTPEELDAVEQAQQ